MTGRTRYARTCPQEPELSGPALVAGTCLILLILVAAVGYVAITLN